MIIDCHGHFTTAPVALGRWRELQIAYANGTGGHPDPSELYISDDDIREAIEPAQLRLMDERGTDLTIFSPRASFMAHHIGGFETSESWARICNDLCARVTSLYPERFAMTAMLPQSPGVDPATSVPELRRAVEELGAVGVNLNPDPSGGHWSSPPLTDPSWYLLYETMIEYDIPAMIHVSTSCLNAQHTTGAYYLGADTTAFMQLLQGNLFAEFPELKFIIPHGGGATPYHWGRFRGLGQALNQPPLEKHLMNNMYFDTCVYHQPGIDLLLEVIDTKNILFASEMIGAVRDIDPKTGKYFDDTLQYINAAGLSESARTAITLENALRVYPRLADQVKQVSNR